MRISSAAGLGFVTVAAALNGVAATEETSCDQISKFAQERLHVSARNSRKLETLQFSCELPAGPLSFQFLIATAPNPIETHLALWFDREIESIQNAADSLRLRFQSAWIPWDQSLLRDQTDIDQRQKQQQQKTKVEREPGVLLFRDEKRGPALEKDLVVLVVPETPTGGIDTKVFCDSVRIVEETTHETPIPVLGPSFSGSFDSFESILRGEPGAGGAPCGGARSLRLRVISGSATSPDAAKDFMRAAKDAHLDVQYQSTVHDSKLLRQILWNWRHSRIAVLSESETRYGADSAEEFMTVAKGAQAGSTVRDSKPLWQIPSNWRYGAAPATSMLNDVRLFLRYPRGISHLRNAYSDQELKTVAGAQPQRSFHNLLTFRIPDVGPATDSTPVFAKDQTPLSQDAVLEEIARTLKGRSIEMAGLVATDPFDALFIARYLKDACPDVRLFTMDSDLLWVRASQDFPFEGTLAVTTYPLMESNQGWTIRPLKDEPPLFPSRASEGIYNAVRALLLPPEGPSGAVQSSEKETLQGQLAEYFDPFGQCHGPDQHRPECQTPPIWITVVSRDGYWPLAVQHVEPDPDSPLLRWPFATGSARVSVGPLPRLWRFLFVMLTGAVLCYCAFVYASLTRLGRKRLLTEWGVWPREEGWLARLCYLTIATLSLLALYTVFVAPLFALHDKDGSKQFAMYSAASTLVIALLTCAALVPALRALFGSHKRPYWNRDNWNYGILVVAGAYIAVFIWAMQSLFFGQDDSIERVFFFAYRSIHLSSSVSPVEPVIFFLAGFFLWAKVHLKRLALLHDRVPWVPTLGKGPEEAALDENREELERVVRDPLPFHWRSLGAFALIVLIWRYLAGSMHSLEDSRYDQIVVLSLSVLYSLLFLTWGRVVLIWVRLRLLLEGLERHPIRFALSALPREATWSPIFRATAGKRSYSSETRMRDGLNILRPYMQPALSHAAGRFISQLETVLQAAMLGLRVPWTDHWELRNRLSDVDRLLIENLQSRWSSKGMPSAGTAGSPPGSSEDPLNVAESLIAFQFVSYIRYTLHQVRNLIYFVTVGFVLSMIALHCYPFQAPRTITTFITIMFTVFAGGIAIVMAQADRDPTLSRITNTTPGSLDAGFFKRVVVYLGVPFVTVIASQVPAWGRFLFSWVQPALEALK